MLEKLFNELKEIRKLIDALKEKEANLKQQIIDELEKQNLDKFDAAFGRANRITKINAKIKQEKIHEAIEKYPITMFELKIKNATKFASVVEEDPELFEVKETTYWQIAPK